MAAQAGWQLQRLRHPHPWAVRTKPGHLGAATPADPDRPTGNNRRSRLASSVSAGTGYVMPAASARFRYIFTVARQREHQNHPKGWPDWMDTLAWPYFRPKGSRQGTLRAVRSIFSSPAFSSRLKSLIKRFVSHVGQISGRKICFVIPGVEGSFGGTNGSGERQVHIGGIG